MRKLIIKYFALSYIFTYKNKMYSYVRASTPITIAFCIMVSLVSDSDYPILSGNDFVGLGLLIIALFFGFVYFSHFPVKYNELDESQRWQYRNYTSQNLIPKIERAGFVELSSVKKRLKEFLPLIINVLTVLFTVLFVYFQK